ncbi:hypothetical protein WICMUC_004221 [Wickerhamomyces mucosus]|uniref:DASH complex subunit DUO1 n=1 Tax=Wickerhamomyces mucosus TaxID=1378264 RepID=A0A9P8PIZ4_9ASCO|nr:hypothetical protein WICMUC_004221 [Wickerhamomyces mucosus]
MSKEIIPTFDEIRNTIESTEDQGELPTKTRQIALEKELTELETINSTIENIIESIEVTEDNFNRIINTSQSTNKLLDIWIKILSQTSHTNSILSDVKWKGLTNNELEYEKNLEKLQKLTELVEQKRARKEKEENEIKRQKLEREQKLKVRKEAMERRVYGRKSPAPPSSSRNSTRSDSSNSRKTPNSSSINRSTSTSKR